MGYLYVLACVFLTTKHLPTWTSRVRMIQAERTVSEMSQMFPHVPYGKAGEGNYGSTLAPVNQVVVKHVKDEILGALRMIPLKQGDTFCIGDYGCADGATSMELIGEMVSSLKKLHGSEVPIQIVYEDQPVNDFNSLFKILHGIIPCPPRYFREMDNVFLLASPINFYQQCVPDGSMHVIISFFAVHWLSRRSTVYVNSIYRDCNSTSEEQRLLSDQAETDWERFLLLRSRELKCGGILAIVIPSDEVPDAEGKFKTSLEPFLKTLTKCWLHFSTSGKISTEEFINTNMDTCHYNLHQIRKPFEDTSSEIYRVGLRLRSARYTYIENVFVSSWRRKLEKEGIDDRKTFAKQYVDAYRCFTNSLFIDGLSTSRSTEEKETIVDELFELVTDCISRINPEELKDDRLLGFVMIEKL